VDKGGIYLKGHDLYSSNWSPDLSAFRQELITPYYKRHLMDECRLVDVKLQDIFKFVEKDLDFWNQILPCQVEAFIEDSKIPYEKTEDELIDQLIRLELYKTFEGSELKKHTKTSFFDNSNRLNFHGIGIIDKKEENISISMSPLGSLIDLPIFVSEEVPVNILKNHKIIKKIYIPEYAPSLLEIIHGIFWEISFYGPPDLRNKERSNLKSIADTLNLSDKKDSK